MKHKKTSNECWLISQMWLQRHYMNEMKQIYLSGVCKEYSGKAYQAYSMHRERIAYYAQQLGRERGNQSTPFMQYYPSNI